MNLSAAELFRELRDFLHRQHVELPEDRAEIDGLAQRIDAELKGAPVPKSRGGTLKRCMQCGKALRTEGELRAGLCRPHQ
jgi:hypothetical protein